MPIFSNTLCCARHLWTLAAALIISVVEAQVLPNDIAGLELWLKADAGITITNDLVGQWDDQSGNNRHAISNLNAIRPQLLNSALNGYPVVSFDGNLDFMEFPEITNLRTVFWVIRESPLAQGGTLRRPLLGHPGGVYYTRSLNEHFWDAGLTLPQVVNGVTRLNQQTINGTTTVVPTEYSIVTLVTTANSPASHITMEANAYGRTWWGELAELIIYSQPLQNEEIISIENYLADKYGPPFVPADDITVEYGYCDTTICACPGFSGYTWSNSETGQCITVSEEGLYTVQLRDSFGRIYNDSIYVYFPGQTEIIDSTICAGESFHWDTSLNNEDYTISWNGSDDNTSVFNTTVAGEYSVHIADTLGCSYEQTFEIGMNNFAVTASLGPDLSICAGNNITLQNTSGYEVEYLWNTGETSGTIVIENSGEYSLIANSAGCQLFDTIAVNIIGIAPTIQLAETIVCEESSVELHAGNVSQSTVSEWNWNIDNNFAGNEATVTYNFADAGWHSIEIYAQSTEGCNSILSDSIYVHPRPDVYYTASQLCNNLPVVLNDNSNSENGNIISRTWTVNSSEFTTTSVSYDATGLDVLNFTLSVEDETGCVSEQNFTQVLQIAPLVNYQYENTCQGELTQFIIDLENSPNTNILSYLWNFGDNTTSNLTNPLHYYSIPNDYSVSVTVVTGNGCSDTHEETVRIVNPPVVNFAHTSACVDIPVEFSDQTAVSNGDEIIYRFWQIAGTEYTGPVVTHTFDTGGSYVIGLVIETESGCEVIKEWEFTIHEHPVASFSFSPETGAAPIEMTFTNESPDISSTLWIFENEYYDDDDNSTHVFTTNGVHDVMLITTDINGCSDSLKKSILIAPSNPDLFLEEIVISENTSGSTMTVKLSNAGNRTITGIKLSPEVGGGNPFSEIWSGTLSPGGELIYTFNSVINQDELPYRYLCVDASILSPEFSENNMANNSACIALTSKNSFEIYPPFPNPSTDRITIRLIDPTLSELKTTLYDALGKEVFSSNISSGLKEFRELSLDVSTLPAGQYVLKISNNTETRSLLILKED